MIQSIKMKDMDICLIFKFKLINFDKINRYNINILYI